MEMISTVWERVVWYGNDQYSMLIIGRLFIILYKSLICVLGIVFTLQYYLLLYLHTHSHQMTEEAHVAVKTCKPDSTPEEKTKFLQEAGMNPYS